MIDRNQAEGLSDGELVELTLADQDNFIYLIGRYKVKLFNYIRRISNVSSEDAEDLLQEIFLKVYLNLNDFDTDLKFSSWIYSIAHNQVISNFRKLRARAEGHAVALDDQAARSLLADFNPEKRMDASLLKDKVALVLESLAGKYREILVLKFLEEKSYEEISDIIKRPMGSVASLLNLAKLEFKKELLKHNYDTRQ